MAAYNSKIMTTAVKSQNAFEFLIHMEKFLSEKLTLYYRGFAGGKQLSNTCSYAIVMKKQADKEDSQ